MQGWDILLLMARLAAEAGDETETLRLVAAAGNIASHYHDVESSSLYGETVVILMDLDLNGIAFKLLLPALGRNADLARWKAVLWKRDLTPTDFASVMRGEWNADASFLTLPILLRMAKNHELPDSEAVARIYTAWFNSCVTRLPSFRLADMADALNLPADISLLSKEGRDVIKSLSIGLSSWTRGYVTAATRQAQSRAALDLLILEKSGASLTTAAAGQVTRDPVSGSPFVLDPAARTLVAPPSSVASSIEPLALPW